MKTEIYTMLLHLAFFAQALVLTGICTSPSTCIVSLLHSLAVDIFLRTVHTPVAFRTARIRTLGALVGSDVC